MRKEERMLIKELCELCNELQDAYLDLVDNAFPGTSMRHYAEEYVNGYQDSLYIPNYRALCVRHEELKESIKKREAAIKERDEQQN